MLAGALMLSAALGGCGLYVPEKSLLSNDNVSPNKSSPGGLRESDIVGHIRCEIREGVKRTAQAFPEMKWFRKWGATVSLKMTVDEIGIVSPGVSVLQPLANAQSFTLGLGATGSAHTTRLETISFTLAFDELLSENTHPCDVLQNGIQIDSDLKIGQFIYDKVFVASVGEVTTRSGNVAPFDIFEDDLTFVASFGGNATPTWKFTRVSADPNSPLLSATRTNTNQVTITLAAATKNAAGQTQLSETGRAHHNAALTGSATALQIQSLTH